MGGSGGGDEVIDFANLGLLRSGTAVFLKFSERRFDDSNFRKDFRNFQKKLGFLSRLHLLSERMNRNLRKVTRVLFTISNNLFQPGRTKFCPEIYTHMYINIAGQLLIIVYCTIYYNVFKGAFMLEL